MGMTITEKILARHAGRDKVAPGENIWVDVDVLMTHDVCGPGTIGVFKERFGKDAKVWNPEKIVIIPDHYIFTADSRAHRNIEILREFVAEQGIKYYYDPDFIKGEGMPNPYTAPEETNYLGVCHVALPQAGHTRPGEVLLGTDSHTCTAGAFGQFATGIGNTDAGFVMGTGKIWLKVPATMRFIFEGDMPDYLMAKDLILTIISEIGTDGATYRAMEFAGNAVMGLNIEVAHSLMGKTDPAMDYGEAMEAGKLFHTHENAQGEPAYDRDLAAGDDSLVSLIDRMWQLKVGNYKGLLGGDVQPLPQDRDDQMAATVQRTKRRVTWAVEQAQKLDDAKMEKLHASHDQAGVLDYLDEMVFYMK